MPRINAGVVWLGLCPTRSAIVGSASAVPLAVRA
jgi:hypothetical protein